MGVVGKLQAAVFFLHNHAQKAVVFNELPRFGRQIFAAVGDVPVVEHAAQFFHRAVDKRLLFGGEFGVGVVQQFVEVGLAGKQLAVPPHRAGIDGGFFGFRHRRSNLFENAENAVGNQTARLGQAREYRHHRHHNGANPPNAGLAQSQACNGSQRQNPAVGAPIGSNAQQHQHQYDT